MDSRQLLDFQYVFTQTDLLEPGQFGSAARDRGVLGLIEPTLEGLHETQVFEPLFRVSYDVRRYVRYAAQHYERRQPILHGVQTNADDLRDRRSEGRLFDPAASSFVAWSRYERRWEDVHFRASDFLYSHYQLTALPLIREIAPRLRLVRRRGRNRWSVELSPREATDAKTFRTAAIVAAALEAKYRPFVTGRARLSSLRDEDFENYSRWRARESPTAVLRKLGMRAREVRDIAEFLLRWAARIDPFGDWLGIIAAGAPMKWDRLARDGRISIELRLAAELHLRFYEDLVERKRARPLPEPSPIFGGPFDGRLGRRNQKGSLDALLAPFSLSPHPRLVLVVEGETERRLFPLLITLLGMRLEDEFIRIIDRAGFRTNINVLIRFAATPRVEDSDRDDYVTLTRPTTRVLVIMDPHPPLDVEAERQRAKARWIELLRDAIQREFGVGVPTSELGHLVEIEVWPNGESFEFAHFTDLELARAIHTLGGQGARSLDEIKATVAMLRAERGNLASALPKGKSKTDLATALWPALQRRVERAQSRQAADRIPAVAAMERARRMVLEVPTGKTALSLREREVMEEQAR